MPKIQTKRKRVLGNMQSYNPMGTYKRRSMLRGRVLNQGNNINNLTSNYSSQNFKSTEKKSFDWGYLTQTFALPVFDDIVGSDPLLSADATGGLSVINAVNQGTTMYQRIGNKIQIKSIRFRGSFSASGSVTNINEIRVALVYDRNPNGAYPLISDIFNDTGNIDGAITNANTTLRSSINMNNKERFLILRDECRACTKNQDSGTQVFDWYIKRKLETSFKASSNPGAIGDITCGAIYLIAGAYAYTDGNVELIPMDIQTRIRYEDL